MNTQKLRWKKRKYFIRINCGIMIALLVAILLFMGFPIVSNADSPTYLKDKYFMNDLLNKEDFLSHNGDEGYYNFRSFILNTKAAILVGTYDYYEENYFDNVKKIFDNVSCNDLVSLGNNYINDLSFFESHDLYIYTRDNDSTHLYFGFYEHSGDGLSTGTDSQIYTIGNNYSGSYIYDLTNDNWSFTQQGYSLRYLLYASGKTYVRDGSNKINDNYTYIDGSVGFGSGGAHLDPVTYPDGSGGEVINNMYMRTADWKFNIPQYWTNTNFVNSNPTDKWGSGNVQFYGLVNDFQKANVSDYNLKFDYYLQLVGSYDGGVSFAHSYALRGVNYPLSDFLSNNNTYQVGVDYIFTNATDINGNNIYTTLEDLRGGQISQVNFSKWELSCSAHLESGNYTSGSIQETYNFLTQISKEVNNTITENNNPYYPPDYDDSSSSNNNNSVVTSKDGQIVLTNYDNDSLVIDNGHDEVINTLYDKLVPDNVSGESGLTQRFVSLTNANQWFNVMTSSLAIFPQEFWTTIYTIFLASLGIIGTAFLLWIVVHIL